MKNLVGRSHPGNGAVQQSALCIGGYGASVCFGS